MPVPVGERTLTEIDNDLLATERAHADHLVDFNAHAQDTFLRKHVDNGARHLPSLPASGTFTLKVINGKLTWVAG